MFPGLSDALGLNDIENLFTVLISTSPHHVFEITGLPVVVMNSQLLFADSFTSTLLDWLSYERVSPCLSILTLTFDWCWIWYRTFNILRWWCRRCRSRDKLDNEDVVDEPGTILATCFTCNRRRKSACWRSSWQISPNIFRSGFGQDIAELCIDRVDVQWLLALVGGGNLSDSPWRSFWASPRSWMVPCQGWSSQNLISSNKF